MTSRKITTLAILAGLALAPLSRAQIPAPPGPVPTLPTVPSLPTTPTVPTTAPTTAPTSTNNLWSFLCPTSAQKQQCTTCLCNTALGQLMSGAAGPINMMSGGLIQNQCANNNLLNDLALPTDSPVGAAAAIQQDELNAKKRRAAVRYLGTVDCNRWPEASKALKNALRGDRNECVRFEAAVVLGTGCCCTHEIIEALRVTVMGVRGDGFPAETSERVRIAAARSLEHCLSSSCGAGGPDMPMGPPTELIPIDPRDNKLPIPKDKAQAPPDPKEYYKKVAAMPRDKVVANAREVLAQAQDPNSKKIPPLSATPRTNSLFDIMSNAFTHGSAPTVASAPAAPAPGTAVATAPAAPSSPAAPAAASVQSAPRQPFFSNLTRALTGRQDGTQTPISASTQPGVVVSRDTDPIVSQPQSLPMPFPDAAPVNTPPQPR